MTKDLLTPTMQEAVVHANANGGKLIRFPGGFWSHAGWLHNGPYWGTTTVEGIVRIVRLR